MKRIIRNRRLTTREAARNQAIIRKVEKEFPPAFECPNCGKFLDNAFQVHNCMVPPILPLPKTRGGRR